jgi:acetoacetate decarboxylase
MQSLMGMARICELQNEYSTALQTINELHVKHSWFAPAVMEKARLSLVVHGWPEAMVCVAQLQQLDAKNVMASAYLGLPPLPSVAV